MPKKINNSYYWRYINCEWFTLGQLLLFDQQWWVLTGTWALTHHLIKHSFRFINFIFFSYIINGEKVIRINTLSTDWKLTIIIYWKINGFIRLNWWLVGEKQIILWFFHSFYAFISTSVQKLNHFSFQTFNSGQFWFFIVPPFWIGV